MKLDKLRARVQHVRRIGLDTRLAVSISFQLCLPSSRKKGFDLRKGRRIRLCNKEDRRPRWNRVQTVPTFYGLSTLEFPDQIANNLPEPCRSPSIHITSISLLSSKNSIYQHQQEQANLMSHHIAADAGKTHFRRQNQCL